MWHNTGSQKQKGYKFEQGTIQRDVQGGVKGDKVVGDHTEGVFIWRTYMRYWAIAYGYVFIFRFIQG